MADPIKQFLDAFNDNNVDRAILENKYVAGVIERFERFGNDLGEQAENLVKNIGKKHANPASVIPPNYQEQQFLEPDNPTTLHNVTAKKHQEPWLERTFSGLSYRVRNWDIEASTSIGENMELSATMGEHAGLAYSLTKGNTKSTLSANYNLRNGKSEIEFYNNNPTHSTSVSVFSQDDNYGASASYYNKMSRVGSSVSIDKNSLSGNISWQAGRNASVGIYANRDFHCVENNVIGLNTRLEF